MLGTLTYLACWARRDKSVILWHLTREEGQYGYPRRALKGHSHFVQDVVISSDGQFALSGSWDGTLRLWNLHTGSTTCRFLGHTKDVLSVAFSADNRQVLPASMPVSCCTQLLSLKITLGPSASAASCSHSISARVLPKPDLSTSAVESQAAYTICLGHLNWH